MFDVDALSFDGDGTLWDHEAAMRAGLRAAVEWFARMDVRTPTGAVTAEWLTDVRNGIADQAAAPVSMEEIRLASFAEALRRCDGDGREAPEVFDLFMAARLGALRPYDDVAGALEAISARYPLALVTNGNTWPAQVGLEGAFRVVVNAAEVGIRKPDPAILGRACSALDVDPGRCLHVGDDPVDDVATARAAGMPAAWCNRLGAAWASTLGEVPLTLSGLDELATYV